MNGYEINLHHLTKAYGSHLVLQDINLTVQAGESVALVGKSGCGKSTLLRLISGLTSKTQGHIIVGGREVCAVNPEIRFLFQNARLLPWKTVLENVILGSPDRDQDTARRVLQEVGLQGREDAWPGDLSGGQQQRVALARALIGRPRVLLLDEPLSALDALTRLHMQRLIERLWQELGFTLVLVTHDVSEAVYLADRVILIEDGHIPLASGERIYSRFGYLPYFTDRSLDVIQPDLGSCGGFSEFRKIADMAHAYEITVQAHVAGTGVAEAAAIQAEASIPNFIIHEHHQKTLLKEYRELVQYDYQPVNGQYAVPDLPGIGQDITEEVYKQSDYFLVNS